MSTTPQFDLKLEGRAISSFSPKEDLVTLDAYLRENKWRGKLEIHYSGSGGRTAVKFEEIRRLIDPEVQGAK